MEKKPDDDDDKKTLTRKNLKRKIMMINEKKTKDKTLKGRNEVDFKWLILTHEGCFRLICQKYNQRQCKNGSDVWIVTPCVMRR